MYNNSNTVMIHEVTQDVLSKDLSSFDIISFDDGLYSQYLHLDYYLTLPQPKYFFISTNIIFKAFKQEQSKEPLYCGDAHNKAFNNNFENYMSWNQIIKIYNSHNCFIGGHSHNHTILKSLRENIKDTDTMIEEFQKHFIQIDSYCFPYNNEYSMRAITLKQYRIKKLFGKHRIAVETL